MVHNPQKLTSYRVFDLLYTEQTRIKDRILGHCMAAVSHRPQCVRVGIKSETRNKNTHSTFPFSKAQFHPTVLPNAQLCVIPSQLYTLPTRHSFRSANTFQRAINPNCTLSQRVTSSKPHPLSKVQFHPNPRSLQQRQLQPKVMALI